MTKKTIPQWLKDKVIEFAKKSQIKQAKEEIKKALGYKKTQTNETYNEIVKGEDIEVGSEEPYHFNSLTERYVYYSQVMGRETVISESNLKAVLGMYSGIYGSPATIEEVARRLKWPRNATEELLRIFSINHKSLPVTPNEFESKDDETIVEDTQAHRKFILSQKLERKLWSEVQTKANNWDNFIHFTYDPFINFLREWQPPKFTPIKKKFLQEGGDKIFLCVLNDTHIGNHSSKDKSVSSREYNSKIATENIDKYVDQIATRLKARGEKFKQAEVVCLGDILHSCLSGFTRRGTQLESDLVDEEMFDVALTCIVNFIYKISALFPKVNVRTVLGNHDSVVLYYLMRAVEKAFSQDKTVKFYLSRRWIESVKFNNVYALLTHGSHDKIKVAVPRGGPKLKTYIQELLLAKNKDIQDSKQHIVLTGHLHSYMQEDFGSFEVFRLGSSVASDDYAEGLGFFSKPRQNCLVIGKDYVEEVLHIHL